MVIVWLKIVDSGVKHRPGDRRKKYTNEFKKKKSIKNFVHVFDRVRTCDLMIFI